MSSLKSILFPVDFSERCVSAAQHVRAMASRCGAKVILLNVVERANVAPGDLDFGALVDSEYRSASTDRARKSLDQFLQTEFEALPVERRVEMGDAARTIVRIAHEERVDLIMMPTHGYGGFRRFILGSVTAKVLHDAECAVWTGVHLENPPSNDGAIQNITCAIDWLEPGSTPFDEVVDIAKQQGAKLTITYAVPGSEAIPDRLIDSEFRQNLISEAKAGISAMLASAGVSAEMCVDAGEVHNVVSACAKAHNADLVVIGRPRGKGLGRLRAHSYAIIRESPCPVISL